MPATSPSTHTPTLPPRGPGVLRYLGVVIAVLCAAVVVVVVSLVVFLPRAPAAQTTTTMAATPSPSPATPTLVQPIEDLAPVELSIGPNDVRASVERSMKKRGLRDGDVPALDALIEKAARLEKQKRDAAALDAWRAAAAAVDKAVVDRGFVFSKQKRLRVAVEARGVRDTKKVDELLLEVDRRFANNDYDGANDALNRAWPLLK